MAAKFVFRVTCEQITVDSMKTGYHIELRNVVLVNRRKGLILALGEQADGVRERLASLCERQSADIETITLFGPDGRDLAYEIRALEHFTRLLHLQGRRASAMSYFAAKVIKGFDYILELPGYESFSEARRHALEQRMQAHLRLRRLVINGVERHIPVRMREMENWAFRGFVRLLPVVAVASAFLAAPEGMTENRPALLAYLLAVLFVFYYGGRALWMLLARRVVPLGYRLALLKGNRDRLSAADSWLARAIWGRDSLD